MPTLPPLLPLLLLPLSTVTGAGEELRAAVEEWQQKRGTPAGSQRLTTAFLDGTHPIVDVYELKVGPIHCHHRDGGQGLEEGMEATPPPTPHTLPPLSAPVVRLEPIIATCRHH